MGLFTKELTVCCPIEGKVSLLEYCPDEVFSKGLTGEGVVFQLEILFMLQLMEKWNLFLKQNMRLLLKSQGVEYLIHVGLDTNKLNGHGFEVFVSSGDEVKQGDILLKFDSQILNAHHCINVTPFVFTNLNRKNITVTQYGMVNANEPFILIERKA